MGKMIYLDNAATTKTAPEVVQAMLPYFSEYYGNPSSIYDFAGKSKEAITKGREQIAEVLGAKKEEIYFTAGGSESDNWALKATFEAYKAKGNHIITTKIEHHAILHTCEYLEKRGAKITYVDVDENGIVKLDELEKAITPETILISVMFANNEIGSIQPIKEIGRIAKEHGVLFHTDAVQAFCQVPINVDECNIDMLSSSGHKINGPKGIGFLYIRKGVKIRSFVHGGAQERKRRAGTENVPGIVGYGVAAARANASMKERTDKEIAIRDHLIHRIETEIPYVKVNGDRIKRLPNNVNVSFQFVEGESLLLMLDNYGICASSGSACTSGSLDPSHVLLAIGLPHEIAHGSLRMTLSEETTMEDVDFVVDRLKEYKIAHRGLGEGVHTFEFVMDDGFFDCFDATKGTKGKVNARVNIVKSSLLMEVRMMIEGTVEAICDRCLEEMKLPISGELNLYAKYGEREEGNDDDFIILAQDDDYLDLSEPLYEVYMLNYPLRVVHPEGECNEEMEHVLEELTMEEENEKIDPRWDELRKLINNN